MKTKISRISRRTVSMVLALLMMVSILGLGSLITASGVAQNTTMTVYFADARGWSEVYAYAGVSICKDDGQGGQVKSPGTPVKMTKVPNTKNLYSCSITIANSNNRIAFSNHNYGDNDFYSDGNPWYEAVYRDDLSTSTPLFICKNAHSWNSWNNSYWQGSWSNYTKSSWTFYVRGSVNNKNWAADAMTDYNGLGAYYKVTKTGDFKILAPNSDWNDTENGNGSIEYSYIDNDLGNGTISLSGGNGSNVTIGTAGYICIDYDTGKIYARTTPPIRYNVNLGTINNGSITRDKTTATQGDTVTLTLSPSSGYDPTAPTVTKSGGGTVTTSMVDATHYTFTMPSQAVTITATFPVTSCSPVLQTSGGADLGASKEIYSHQILKFKTNDPNSHAATYTVYKNGSTTNTASTYLSAYSSVANNTLVTFTPSAITAGSANDTYVITSTCTGGGSDTVTVTVKEPANVTFKYSTNSSTISGGGNGIATDMTYDSAATTTLGGTEGHAVYSLTDFSFAGTSAYYWAIWTGSKNVAYNTAITSSTSNAKLGQTGISTVALSSSLKTITPSGSEYHYNLYYDVVTDKFYIEYPIKMTTYRSIGPNYSTTTAEKIADTYIAYNTAFSTPSNPSKTGYSFTSGQWYTNNQACTGSTTDFSTKLTANTSFYAKMVAKTSTLSFDTNGATTAGTRTLSTSYATYGVAMPSFSSYTAPTKTGYALDGWYTATVSNGNVTSWGTKYYNANGSSATNWAVDTTSGTTLYAKWNEVKAGVIVKAFTGGSESSTGGKVKYNTGTLAATATVANDAFGYTTASNAITGTANTGYHITGWKFNYTGSSNTKYTHLLWSTDGSTWNTVANSSTLYNQPGNATTTTQTIYLKTDGTSGITNANTQVQAMFEINSYAVTVNRVSADTQAEATANTYSTDNSAGTITIDSVETTSANKNYNTQPVLVATPASGYKFIGWYNGSTSSATLLSSNSSYTLPKLTGAKTVYARFDRKYTLTIQNGSADGTLSTSTITTFYSDSAPASFTVTPNAGKQIDYSNCSASFATYYGHPVATTGTVTMTGRDDVANDSKIDNTITIAYTDVTLTVTKTAEYKNTTAWTSGNTGGTIAANTYTESTSGGSSGGSTPAGDTLYVWWGRSDNTSNYTNDVTMEQGSDGNYYATLPAAGDVGGSRQYYFVINNSSTSYSSGTQKINSSTTSSKDGTFSFAERSNYGDYYIGKCETTYEGRNNPVYIKYDPTGNGSIRFQTTSFSYTPAGGGSSGGGGGGETTYTDDPAGSFSSPVAYNTKVRFSATPATGYSFIGFFDASGNVVADLEDCTEDSGTYYYRAGALTDDYIIKARFAKNYYITLYNTWKEIDSRFVFVSAPPKTVTVTNGAGVETVYTYSKSGTTGEETIVSTDGANYSEGNKLLIHAGDEVELKYSALASSDVITGAFFNNDIRYTTENQTDNIYLNRVDNRANAKDFEGNSTPNATVEREDGSVFYFYGYKEGTTDEYIGDDFWDYTYAADTTLRADPNYYTGTAAATAITAAQSGYKATIDQSNHTVTWTATQDYLNIDLELATKKQIVFSEKDNIKITHENTDDYYNINEEISNLKVAAKGTTNQTNTITVANIKYYYYSTANKCFTDASGNKVSEANRVEIPANTITATASGATSANNGSTDGTNITFNGDMPATDVYVDLNLVVTYALNLDSTIVSDVMESKTKFRQVATITATKGGSAFQSQAQNDTAGDAVGPNNVTAGESVTYTYSFYGDWGTYYMFNGWYKGDSSGPDYENGLLSTKDTFTYKPTENTTVYAVGTRDLFINGSKYITGADEHWNNNGNNFKMKFDPSYYDSTNDKWGRYYWTIDSTIFDAADNTYYVGNTYKAENEYYDNNDNMGNSFFKIFDAEDNQTALTYWTNITKYKQENSDITYGKLYFRDGSDQAKNGNGYISFTKNSSYSSTDYWSTYKEDYDAPITIYAYPAKYFSVSSTPIYPHIYVSNGYNGIDTAGNDSETSRVEISVNNTAITDLASLADDATSSTGLLKKCGPGWDPSREGKVFDYQIKARDAKVKLTKTTAAGYKVSSFVVYNLSKKKDAVTAVEATNTSGTTYTAEVQMNGDEKLYIVPIIESTSANMKVVVDATQLDTNKWGDLIGCYAWYSNGIAYGDYPGQLMVPDDDGLSYSANFPATKGEGKLVGITFSNYLDGTNTWLGCTNVLGSVGTQGNEGSGNIIPTYNLITNSSNSGYNRTNFKCQTYDYREPQAFYTNKDEGATSFLMNFSLKSGNSPTQAAMTARHSELTSATIPGSFDHKHSDGEIVHNELSFSQSDFEYLTDTKGNYTDMNGMSLGNSKPTASFYVIAKGMVNYTSGSMNRVFYSGTNYDSVSDVSYPNTGSASGASVSQEFAVEWYVYDASGEYITNMLSAGYADKTTTGGTTTLIANKLDDLGYAVDGRAVAICYDSPRYCYSKSGGIANTDSSNFDAYRFTGQWKQLNAYETAKVYAEVGMLTDNGEEFSGSSTAAYGSATLSVNSSKLSHAVAGTNYGTGSEDGVNYAYTTIADGEKKAITLTASATNFAGWYFYNADGVFTLATKSTTLSPTYSKDVTYYAMYEARAIYAYQYQGRQGAKAYSVDGGALTEAEITDSNKVAKTRTDFGTKTPGSNAVSIFKKTITWDNTVSANDSRLNNDTDYTMKISNATIDIESFNFVAYYPNSSGTNTAHAIGPVKYNKGLDGETTGGVDMTSYIRTHEEIDNITVRTPAGKVFYGWYEYNPSGETYGRLLSTQPNFGQSIVKDTTIAARFGEAPVPSLTGWEVTIEDNGVTREMYTATSGTTYNDSIICVRNNGVSRTSLPSGGKIGVIMIEDGGTGRDIGSPDVTKLTSLATALDVNLTGDNHNGIKTGKTSNGFVITNAVTDSITEYGRTDLAIKRDYSTIAGHNYKVYAYIYDGTSYHFDLTHGTDDGTYETFS